MTLEAAVDSMERVDGLEGPYPDLFRRCVAERGAWNPLWHGKGQVYPQQGLGWFPGSLGGSAGGGDWQARALADPGPLLAHYRPLAHDGTAHAAADLCGVHVGLGEGAAQGVAMHPQLYGGLTLVALVLRKHFKDVTLLELPHGIRIRDTGTVHLRDEGVHFALQDSTSLTFDI